MASKKEFEAKGTLTVMLIYASIFAILWFVIYAITLARGIVG
ncbi:cytochrome c oxidase subunit 2A [Pyrobaculum aerophilum]|uniref:Cytochrome c oxidase subunit 2A n=1 Tax=Pyrobaculum aerophilum TaxID=13773 RepID=A0A371R4U7_9CREN|nr:MULTISPECIES: cytochrome c oxidase subunit 2A [Pyrobaculum]MCX8135667.1 cytochrome c oxidase subunit 2A [Pyrobaculum aerophilum]RFA95732.1 cytochrome c oxidase subunit 2A [Pyrobaculum aerophilum]RFA99060.1 cytochrome c oxidase subunit 2A [Pyrobaculum aerophilum]HII45974.1 cytochrome c oxidase subunit 2A [Pyrobaculum aerophilum]